MLLDEKMMETDENWYSSFFFHGPTTPELNPTQTYVRVSFYELRDKTYRVCVWGNDDFGMELDFSDFSEARECYKTIASPVEEERLLAQGFDYA